ncbi:hypothetical protein [Nocardia sp. NPDC060249]
MTNPELTSRTRHPAATSPTLGDRAAVLICTVSLGGFIGVLAWLMDWSVL